MKCQQKSCTGFIVDLSCLSLQVSVYLTAEALRAQSKEFLFEKYSELSELCVVVNSLNNNPGRSICFNLCGVNSPQLAVLCKSPIRSPSFPHALSGNPAGSELDPDKNIGGDAWDHRVLLNPRFAGFHFAPIKSAFRNGQNDFPGI